MNPVDAIGYGQVSLRLGAAVLIGAVLGLNRILRGKPAGLRTHALVALGAALATMLAYQPRPEIGADAADLGRVLQGILTGVGFLGAGVILREPEGHVTGLTTAATIWVCAGLGVVCGLGYWSLASLATLLAFAVLLFGRRIERATERVFAGKHVDPPDPEV